MIPVDNDDNGTLLRREPVSGLLSYRVIRGSVDSLREADESIDLGTVACLQPDSPATTTTGHEDAEIPAVGKVSRLPSGGGCGAN